jgi:Ca-activated chloride channel family protein
MALKRDHQGNIVHTKLNQENLLNIAKQGHGEYHYSRTIEQTVRFMKEQIEKVNATAGKQKLVQRTSFYQPFILLALAILLLEIFLPPATI